MSRTQWPEVQGRKTGSVLWGLEMACSLSSVNQSHMSQFLPIICDLKKAEKFNFFLVPPNALWHNSRKNIIGWIRMSRRKMFCLNTNIRNNRYACSVTKECSIGHCKTPWRRLVCYIVFFVYFRLAWQLHVAWCSFCCQFLDPPPPWLATTWTMIGWGQGRSVDLRHLTWRTKK